MNSYYTPRKVVIILILILILAGFMRLFYFSGYRGFDDAAYALLANQMANGEFKIGEYAGPPVFPLRTGLLLPVALIFKIAGPGELSMVIYPFVLSMLSIILVFFAGRLFFNIRVGLIAAMIQAILPIDVRSASLLMPDLPTAFWINLGILLLYCGARRETSLSKGVYGILSGFAFGVSWLCKATVAYLLPFIGVYMIWLIYHQRRNLVLFVSTGMMFLGILLAESLVYYRHTLDFLYRFHEIERNYKVCKIWFFNEGTRFGWAEGEYWLAVMKRIFITGPKKIIINQDFGLVTGVAMVTVAYAALRRFPKFLLVGLWFFSFALMFNFGSSSLQSYRPLVLVNRYMYPLLLPAIVLSAGLLDELLPLTQSPVRRWTNYKKAWGGIVLFVVIIFSCISGIHRFDEGGVGSLAGRAISQILVPADRIYTDSITVRVLSFFWKYPQKTQLYDFKAMETSDIPKETYVLINRDRADFLNSTYGYVLPAFYKDIPTYWVLRWSEHHAELYWVPKNMNEKEEY